MPRTRKVDHIIAQARNPCGDEMELVFCTDRTYGIRCGNEVMSAFLWPEGEFSYAIEEFVRLMGSAKVGRIPPLHGHDKLPN